LDAIELATTAKASTAERTNRFIAFPSRVHRAGDVSDFVFIGFSSAEENDFIRPPICFASQRAAKQTPNAPFRSSRVRDARGRRN
jgi:hypothetical protein